MAGFETQIAIGNELPEKVDESKTKTFLVAICMNPAGYSLGELLN